MERRMNSAKCVKGSERTTSCANVVQSTRKVRNIRRIRKARHIIFQNNSASHLKDIEIVVSAAEIVKNVGSTVNCVEYMNGVEGRWKNAENLKNNKISTNSAEYSNFERKAIGAESGNDIEDETSHVKLSCKHMKCIIT
ncbi:hypothetical protein Tcan_01033, partial [Toxocara canis]